MRRSFVLLCMLIVCFAHTAAAQNVNMSLQLGFQDNQTPMGWVPLWVEISADEDLEGEVRIKTVHEQRFELAEQESQYILPVSLPAGAVRIFPAVIYYTGHALTVELYVEDRLLAVSTTSGELFPISDYNVLVISSQYAGFDFLAHTQESKVSVFYTTPDFLPDEWLGYGQIQAVIIHKANLANISPNQVEALLNWLSLGNILIWTGADGYGFLDAPLFRQLFSNSITHKQLVKFNLESKEPSLFGEVDALELWQVEPDSNASIFLKVQGNPILVSSAFQQGNAFFLTFDPNSPQLIKWRQKGLFFTQLFEFGYSPLNVTGVADGYLDFIAVPNSIMLPGKIVILLVSIIFISFVLLINYLVISYKLSLTKMLIFTIMIIIISSSLIYNWFKPWIESANNTLCEIAIIQKKPVGSRAFIESYYIYFNFIDTPPKFKLQRSQGSFTSLLPGADDRFYQPSYMILPRDSTVYFNSNQDWLIGGFRSSYSMDIPVFIEYALVDDLLKVLIINDSPLQLDYSVLYYHDQWFLLGSVEPGSGQVFVTNIFNQGLRNLQQLVSDSLEYQLILMLNSLQLEKSTNPILVSIFAEQSKIRSAVEVNKPVNHSILPILVSELIIDEDGT